MSEKPFSSRIGDSAGDPIDAVRELIGEDPAPQPTEAFWSKIDDALDEVDHADQADVTAPDRFGSASDNETPRATVASARAGTTQPAKGKIALMAAAAAAILLIGGAVTLRQRETEPASLTVAAQPEEETTQATAEPAPTAVPTETIDDAALQQEERRQSFDRLMAGLTAEEIAILDNHGRAATAIYNIDGGLFFSLADIAPFGDVTFEQETERRVRCFLDGLQQSMSPDELLALDRTEPLHAVAQTAYLACVPAEEVYERFIRSWLFGHIEYSQNIPRIELTDPCFEEVYGSPTEFVRSLGEQTGQRLTVIACVEARDGTPTDVFADTEDSPQFELPEVATGLTPVGHGRVVGRTPDGSGLYTVAATPGSATTCLQSPVLQFYIQPLDGRARLSAGPHLIDGEAVTAFASDQRHAVWVEFCEFSESVYVADITADGMLLNSRPVTSISGENRVGSVSQLHVDDGVVQVFLRPDEQQLDANGAVREVIERVDIDLASDRVIARTALGSPAEVEWPGPVTFREGQTQRVVLPNGDQISLPGGNFGYTVAYDPATAVLYSSLSSAAPDNAIIVAHGQVATSFRALGLRDNEQLLATVDGGQAWLISQTSGCSSELIVRSVDGQDRTVLASDFPITSLVFDSGLTWHSRGWCGEATVPDVQSGTVSLGDGGRVAALQIDLTAHVRVPNWEFVSVSRASDALSFRSFDESTSLTLSHNGGISIDGASAGSNYLVRAQPLPVLVELFDGWQALPAIADGAALTLHHTSGATVSFYGNSDQALRSSADMERRSLDDRSIPHEQSFRSETLTAQVDEYRGDSAQGAVVTTIIEFAVAGTDVYVRATVPPNSDEAVSRIEEMLRTLRYVEPTN